MSGADLSGLNAGYVAQMLEAYLDAPASVSQEWRDLFERDPAAFAGSLPGLAGLLRRDGTNGATAAPAAARPRTGRLLLHRRPSRAAPPRPSPSPCRASGRPLRAAPRRRGLPGRRRARTGRREAAAAAVDENLLGGVAAAMALVKAYRMHGHLAARLDPLGSEPMGDPALDESRLVPSLTPELQSRIPASLLRLYVGGRHAARGAAAPPRRLHGLDRLRDRAHLRSRRARLARQAIESGRFRQPLDAEERKALLHRLSEAEGFEQYLRRSFLGQKQFSLEGSRVARADARRDDRARRGRGRARGRDRDGPPRPAQRARAHRRPLLSVDPARVRGRALARRARRRSRGWHGRRQVPPAGVGHAGHAGRRDRRHDRPQSEPPRGGRPRRRGSRPGRADRPLRRCRHPRSVRRAARPDPRRCGVPGAGRRRRDPEPAVARGLRDGRHAPPDHEQPGRLHDRPDREPLDPLLERPGQGIRRADRARQRRRSRGGAVGRAAGARLPDGVRPRLRDRPRRLPPLRPQRAGRRVVHAAADGRADPAAADGARRLCRAARRGGRDHRRRGRGARRRGHGDAARRRTSSCGRPSAPPRLRPPSRPSRSGRRRRATRSSPPSRPTGCAR